MADAATAATAATTTDPAAAATTTAASTTSALGAAGTDYFDIPEKYRVSKEDKSFDLEASARKLAQGYAEAAKKIGGGEAPPEKPDDYTVEGDLPGGVKWDELKSDPEMQSFLKGAHAKGMNNAQIKHVVEGYAKFLTADQAVKAEDCQAQLAAVWKDDATRETNMKAAHRGALNFAQKAGMQFSDLEAAGLGNNPAFIRLMAVIGAEIKEDSPPNQALPLAAETFDKQLAEIDEELRKMHISDPKRATLLDKKIKLYEQRGKKAA